MVSNVCLGFASILTFIDQEDGNINYLMFSATFPKAVQRIAREHVSTEHVRIRVGRAGSTTKNIIQDIIYVDKQSKLQALEDLLFAHPPARTIIFANSRRTVDELDDHFFNNLKMPVTSIHGDRTQLEREDSMRAFRNGTTPILITTAVSARGLDIAQVMHVINYDLPSAEYGGIREYTHRIGKKHLL